MKEGQNGGLDPAPAKRLIITHMTLENFKSYAGVQHIGPFHKVSNENISLNMQFWHDHIPSVWTKVCVCMCLCDGMVMVILELLSLQI
jgi:hypothetical protein